MTVVKNLSQPDTKKVVALMYGFLLTVLHITKPRSQFYLQLFNLWEILITWEEFQHVLRVIKQVFCQRRLLRLASFLQYCLEYQLHLSYSFWSVMNPIFENLTITATRQIDIYKYLSYNPWSMFYLFPSGIFQL